MKYTFPQMPTVLCCEQCVSSIVVCENRWRTAGLMQYIIGRCVKKPFVKCAQKKELMPLWSYEGTRLKQTEQKWFLCNKTKQKSFFFFFFNFSSELSLAKIARMFSLRKDVGKGLESRTLLRQAWRDTALVSVLGKQREMNLWVPGLPGLHCKSQASYDSMSRP